MDPISKALEKTRAEQRDVKRPGRDNSVRDWVRPNSEKTSRAPTNIDLETINLDTDLLRRNLVLSAHDDPIVFDRYRLLRTRLTQMMASNDWRSVGITSPGAKDGKTLTATNLALALARDSDSRVFLIDGDLRKPSVGDVLGLNSERKGVIDYLRNQVSLADVAISIDIEPNLIIVPGRYDHERLAESELGSSHRMSDLFADIRAYDRNALILVDFPPVLVGDDVIALAPQLDSMLLVIAEGRTNVNELTSSVELLAGLNLLGTVLNRSTEKVKVSEGYYSAYQSVQGQD